MYTIGNLQLKDIVSPPNAVSVTALPCTILITSVTEHDRLLASYYRLSVRPSAMLCIVARVGVGSGGLQFYVGFRTPNLGEAEAVGGWGWYRSNSKERL